MLGFINCLFDKDLVTFKFLKKSTLNEKFKKTGKQPIITSHKPLIYTISDIFWLTIGILLNRSSTVCTY